MNDCCGCTVSTIAAPTLAYLVGSSYGWIGGIAGFFGGAVGAIFFVNALGAVYFALAIRSERNSKRRALYDAFGEYWKEDTRASWEDLVARIDVEHAIIGKVVHRFRYGVAIEFGEKFPGILEKLNAEWDIEAPCPEIGTEIEARVIGFDKKLREVILGQRDGSIAII